MLLSSPLTPLFYLCKVWVHKDDICMWFQVHFIDRLPLYYHQNIIWGLYNWTSEIGTTSKQRTKDPFPKCPLFGGSTVYSRKLQLNKLSGSSIYFRVLWSEWNQQDHGGKCEDETIQPPQCYQSHWCLPKCWSCSLHSHAFYGQRQFAVLPQREETKLLMRTRWALFCSAPLTLTQILP